MSRGLPEQGRPSVVLLVVVGVAFILCSDDDLGRKLVPSEMAPVTWSAVASLTPQQQVLIGAEASTARGFIQHGVTALVALDGANNFQQLPLQLLSIGLERFFKTTMGLVELERNGAWPKDLKDRFWHDLQKLAAGLVVLMKGDAAFAKRCADDVRFLQHDKELGLLLRALTIYGEAGRYYNLELTRGAAKLPGDPEHAWSDIENACLDALPDWKIKLFEGGDSAGFCAAMAARLTERVQRCARAPYPGCGSGDRAASAASSGPASSSRSFA